METQVKVYPNTAVFKGDVFRITTDQFNPDKLKKVKSLAIKAELDRNIESLTKKVEKLFETVITPYPFFVNKSINPIDFRQLLDQVLVLGIRQKSQSSCQKLL